MSTVGGFLLLAIVCWFFGACGSCAASTAQAAAIEQLAAFTAQFPQIVAQLGLGGKRKA